MLKLSFKWQSLSLLGMMAAALATGPLAHAQTWSTAPGATDSAGDPVSATATFHVVAGAVQIDLQNLLVNQKDVGQSITDLFFTLSTPQNVGTLTGSGTFGTVDNHVFNSQGTKPATHWALEFVGNSFHLNDLSGGQPVQTILGLPDAGGLYSNANGSINNNPAHNGYFVGVVSFNIANASIPSTATVSNVLFSFGTEPGDNVPGVRGTPPPPNMTPEGSSLFLMAPGLLPVMWFGIRRRFAKNV